MKKSLLKLIEYSILPAVCIFTAKLVGIFFTGLLFNISIDLKSQAGGGNILWSVYVSGPGFGDDRDPGAYAVFSWLSR